MKIIAIRPLEGPNIHSHKPVLVMRLQLEDLTLLGTDERPEFVTTLLTLLPGLHAHPCPKGVPGGFVEQLRKGADFGHVVEHVALELSSLAGYPTPFGKTRHTGAPGHYDVIVEYMPRQATEFLLRSAVEIVEKLLAGENVTIAGTLARAAEVVAETELGPSTRAIVEAATARNIPWTRIGDNSLIQLGYGRNRKLVAATVSSRTSAVGVDIACDKELTRTMFERASIPVPAGSTTRTLEEAIAAFERMGPPVVLKPLDGHQGKGVSTNLATHEEVAQAFAAAREHGREVIVERFIKGGDYRIVCVDGRFVAAAERLPAHVTGDGARTIEELIGAANQDPMRGDGHEKPLTRIHVDDAMIAYLKRQGMTLASIPEPGRDVQLRSCANLSKGGIAIDVTDQVHPTIRAMCERAARVAGLDICGIDFVAQSITEPLRKETGAIVEINAAPGIRMHHHPWKGTPRDVGGAIVEMLFPAGTSARIPIAAVTGTNGKTTVTRMIRHVLTAMGRTVGMTCTDGIWIGDDCVARGDMSGPRSAQGVLADPAVDVAVLETARGGILRSGLGYDWADVGVITNIRPDHIGQDGIESIEDLIDIKALVAERIRRGGSLVINADDDGATALLHLPRISKATRDIVLFTLQPNRPNVRRHIASGGRAVGLRDGWIVEIEEHQIRWVMAAADIPAALGGAAEFHIANALAAVAACRALGASREVIAAALSEFGSERNNPGRTELFRVGAGYVMVDYGHNPDAFRAICAMTSQLRGRKITGVIGVPGDRVDALIQEAGCVAARRFDKLIVREDHDTRGRQPGETATLLYRAIREEMPERECLVIHDESAALLRAIEEMQPEEIVVMFYDKYEPVIDLLRMKDAEPAARIAERSAHHGMVAR